MRLVPVRAGVAVALFLGLYLGHILGDFVFQPGRLVIAKRRRLSAVLTHTGIVTACTAIVLSSALATCWPAVLLAGAAHFGVEHLTIRARRLPESSNLTVFLLDQGLHVVSMALIALLTHATVVPALGPWQVSLQLLAALAGVSTVAFGGSIVVFEVQMAREPVDSGSEQVLGFDPARAYGMFERGLGLTAALAFSPAYGLLAFVPRLALGVFGIAERRKERLTAGVIGLALCVIAWIMVVSVG